MRLQSIDGAIMRWRPFGCLLSHYPRISRRSVSASAKGRRSIPSRYSRHVDELMREYAGRAFYGAVAHLQADESADAYAECQRLFVIRATGSSTSITNHEDFRPRTFGGGVRSSGPEARS